MPFAESWIDAPDGISFYTRRYTPAGDIKACLILAHGFMEHVTRYDHVFERLVLAGISIFAFDQRGFGKTASKTSTQGITSWPAALRDLDFFVRREANRTPNKPLFLFGHSMGGALVLAYATRQPRPPGVAKLAGIVASAPLIEQSPGVKANGLLIRAGSIIGSVLPSLQLKAGVASTDICRDPAVVEAYAADPLCPPIGSVRDHTYSEEDPLNPHVAQYRGVADMLLGGQKLIKEVSRWPDNLPILIYHGTDDRITHFDGTKRLFDNIPDSVQDKTFTPYEGYYHELHNEPGEEKWVPIKEVEDWIMARSHVGNGTA